MTPPSHHLISLARQYIAAKRLMDEQPPPIPAIRRKRFHATMQAFSEFYAALLEEGKGQLGSDSADVWAERLAKIEMAQN